MTGGHIDYDVGTFALFLAEPPALEQPVWTCFTKGLYHLYNGSEMRANIRKRTYNLDGEMIERVRRLYDAKTDTEAIQMALRKAIDDREIEEALDALLRAGRFRTVYR